MPARTSSPSSRTPVDPPALADQRLDLRALAQLAALVAQRLGQRGDHDEGSTLASPGASMPPATRGERPGSRRRSARGPSHSRVEAQLLLEAVQAAQLLGVVAVGGHHQRAVLAQEVASSPSREANAGQRSRASRLIRSSRSSPKSASVTGASMPAATPEAPAPTVSRSATSTD